VLAECLDWRNTLVRLVLQPAIYLFVFAYVLGGVFPGAGGVDYTRVAVPGVVVMAVMQNAIAGAGGALLNGYYFRTMEAWRLLPVGLRALLWSRLLSGVSFGLLGGLAVTALARAMLGFVPASPALYGVFLGLGALFFALLAVLVFVLPRYPDGGQELLALTMTPMGFFGCTFYSYAMLPPHLAPFALAMPTTYFAEGLRDAANGASASFAADVLCSGLLAAVALGLVLADWAFRRRFKDFLW
jgi:ABC-type multidrug transport system permease subunit